MQVNLSNTLNESDVPVQRRSLWTVILLSLLWITFPANAQTVSTPEVTAGSVVATVLEVINDGANTHLTWNSHPEAIGYNVYQNGDYQTTVTLPRYSDAQHTVPSVYYVVPFGRTPIEFFAPSNTISLSSTTIDTTQPTVPDGISASVTNQSILLDWNSASDDTGVAGYNLYLDGNYYTTVSENQHSIALSMASANSFQVSAFDAYQNFSPLSDSYDLTLALQNHSSTSELSAPANVQGSIQLSGDQLSANLDWSAANPQVQIAGYNVYRDDQYLSTVTSNSFVDSSVGSSTHSYYIVAFDHNSNFSGQSSVLTLSAPNTMPTASTIPTPATGLNVEQQTTNNITELRLTWTAGTDDKRVVGYNIYLNNEYHSSTVNTQFTVQANTPGTYVFYVVAYDGDNQFSLPSSEVSATVLDDLSDNPVENLPPSGAPAAPHNFYGTIENEGSQARIKLFWSTPASANPVVSYNIYENNFYLATVNGNNFEKVVNLDEFNSYYVIAIDNSQSYSQRSERVRLPDRGNQAPYFYELHDVTAYAGETLSVHIRPVDSDSDVPGLETGKLPEGMNFLDNRDGTRTLEWRLLEPQVGTHFVSITAMDAEDSTLRTTRNLKITVLLPDDLSTIPNLAPAIDHIPDHVIRAGDTIIMHVKGTDPNGHIPHVKILNPPNNSTFWPYHEDDAITELRWTATEADKGTIDLWFEATDTRDTSLRYQRKTTLEIKDASSFDRAGSRLRHLADQYNLKIGYASLLGFFAKTDSDLYKTIASEEFSIVSSENSMKWSYTNPEPGEYRWDGADNLVRFAADNNMLVHGHTLVWYSALPQWVLESNVADRESLMYGYIDQIMRRYPDVHVWDVVNEAFEEDGSYRNSIWYQAMGESHIEKAFYRARANDPDAKLIYNDYNISWAGPKSDATFNLVKSLKEKGVPIDGIGFQMHLDSNFDQFLSVRDTFNRFAALGVDIYITELDVSMTTSLDENQQARVFAEVLAICLEQPRCKAYQIWGFTDRYTWLPNYDPLIFDRNYQPKPAYQALQEQFTKRNYPWR